MMTKLADLASSRICKARTGDSLSISPVNVSLVLCSESGPCDADFPSTVPPLRFTFGDYHEAEVRTESAA
jgi:hypothetical protein